MNLYKVTTAAGHPAEPECNELVLSDTAESAIELVNQNDSELGYYHTKRMRSVVQIPLDEPGAIGFIHGYQKRPTRRHAWKEAQE